MHGSRTHCVIIVLPRSACAGQATLSYAPSDGWRWRWRGVIAALLMLPLLVPPVCAQRLPPTVTPEHYDLSFVVDLAAQRFEGTETIRVRVAQPTRRIVLHAAEIKFQRRDHHCRRRDAAGRRLARPQQRDRDAHRRDAAALPARPRSTSATRGILNNQLRGFYISKSDQRSYAVTQFEATDARRAFPCFDEPAFKATFAVTLTIDRGDTAISNGRVSPTRPGPDPDQHTVKFATTPKMSSYLVAMAVGDFECLEGSADGDPDPHLRDAGQEGSRPHRARVAQQILTFYNGYYTINYPFGKLDIVAVPDFAAGAMENTAAIFYRETRSARRLRRRRRSTTRKKICGDARARDGAPVVRQSGHDAVVGRPLAERRVRHLDGEQAARRGATGVEHRRSTKRADNQTALDLDSLRSTRADPRRRARRRPRSRRSSTPSPYQKGAAVLRMIEQLRRRRARSATASTPTSRRTRTATRRPRLLDGHRRAHRASRSTASCRRSSTSPACRSRLSRSTCTRTADSARRSGSSGSSVDPTRRGRARRSWQIPVCLKTAARPTACLPRHRRRPRHDQRRRQALCAVGLRERRRPGLLPHRLLAGDAARDGAARRHAI